MDPLGERLPYLVTLLFAAVGWGVTHTVDRVLKSPIVEYQTQVSTTPAGKVFHVRLRNLSQDRVYKNVRLVMLLPVTKQGVFESAGVDPKPPAWEGAAGPLVKDYSVQFHLPALYPSWEFELKAKFTGSEVPVLRMSEADPALRLAGPSLETFLFDHEITIIAVAIGVWAALLLLLIAMRSGGRQGWPGSSR